MSRNNIFDLFEGDLEEFIAGFSPYLSEYSEPSHKKNPKKPIQDFSHHIYDPELIRSLTNLYINGMCLKDISNFLGISTEEVDALLDRIIPYLD
jgi:hypothetical protein